jgi:hypothetical protein
MFKVVVGHSEDPDSLDAIKEVLSQCKESLEGITPKAGVMFASPDYEHKVILDFIQEQYPGLELIGCTSSGEMSSTAGYMEGSLVLALFCSDKIDIHAGVVRNIYNEDQEAFDTAVKEVLSKSNQEARLAMTFPDIFTGGLGVGFVRAVEGLQKALGDRIPLVGAGATDLQFSFVTNSEFYNNEVLHQSAPFLIFSGPLKVAINSESGWQPFSAKKLIFEHVDNVITKIGDYSALDFFKHYLGGPPSLPFPLAVFQADQGDERFYLRIVITADEDTGTLTMGAEIPENLMSCSIAKAEPDHLIEIMRELVAKTTKDLKQTPSCTFIASCTCRQAVLGTRIREENKVLQEAYTTDSPCFGLYAYGQLGPLHTGGKPFVHNETVVVVSLGEENG